MALLVVDRLTKSFGGLVAVDDVSIAVEAGEIVGLIGPNGSGKSTLFEVVSGFQRPTAGRVVLDGQRLDGLAPHRVLARGVARVFQTVQLFPSLTVEETLTLCALHRSSMRDARETAAAVARLVKLDGALGHPVTSLSLPDHKRLEFAKLVAMAPRVALLDELMAGLTEGVVSELSELVARLRRDERVTFLVVEHRMEVILGLCDRVVALNFGRKIAEGTPREVARHPDVVDAYLGEEMTLA